MITKEEVTMRLGLAAAKMLEKNPKHFKFAKLVVDEQAAAIHKLAQTTDEKIVHQVNVTLDLAREKIA